MSTPSKSPNLSQRNLQKNLNNGVTNPPLESQKQELLVMTIDLGNGRKDLLRVFEGEDPFQLAKNFCARHNLNSQLIEPLAQNIYGNMEHVLQESVETLNMGGNNPPKESIQETIPLSESIQNSDNYRNLRQKEPDLEENEGCEMLRSYENEEPPIIAERVNMSGSKKSDSPAKSALFKSLEEKKKMNGVQAERQVKSALIMNENQGKKQQYLGDSWPPVEQMLNEEEHQEYGLNSGQAANKGKQENEIVEGNKSQGQLPKNRPQSGKLNVYERLHSQAKPKADRNTSPKPSQSGTKTNSTRMSQSQSSQDINYGTLLYHRGLKKNQEIDKQIIEKRKQKLELAEQECTFKPTLNRISQQIISTKARFENVPDMLIQSGKKVQDKLERARSAQKAKEESECTFRPQVNIISNRIDQEKSKMSVNVDQDRCLRLFQESKLRQDLKTTASRMLSDEYTFKPSTIEYKENSSVQQTTFEERDKKFRERLERINYMRQLKEEAELYDPETGEPLFKPKTGRAPKSIVPRNVQNQSIGEYLYNQKFKLEESKKKLNEQVEKNLEAKKPKPTEKSKALVENLMRRRLESLFAKMDLDCDGLISSAKIDITNVEIEVLEILAPVLCEMEEKNYVLDFQSFFEQVERLLKYLTVAEKDILLLGKKETSEPQYRFQPEIDKKSEKLAQKKHPYGDFRSLYKSYIEERNKTKEKIQKEQEKKTQDELKECSFKPRLYSKKDQTGSVTSVRNSTSSFANNYFMDDLLL